MAKKSTSKTRSAPAVDREAYGSALVNSKERLHLKSIGKKMDALLNQVDELFYQARDLIGFEQREFDTWTELPDWWESMGEALVRYAINERGRWKQEEAIERINAEMKKLRITTDMLARQNSDSQTKVAS